MQRDVPTAGATISDVSTQTLAAGLQLVVVEHGCLARCALPRSGSIRIGRSEASEVVLSDPAASRVHALLHVGRVLEIEDLGSHNGTRVRNQRLTPHQRMLVALGDSIQVGNAVLIAQQETGPVRSAKARGEQPIKQSTRKLIVN